MYPNEISIISQLISQMYDNKVIQLLKKAMEFEITNEDLFKEALQEQSCLKTQ